MPIQEIRFDVSVASLNVLFVLLLRLTWPLREVCVVQNLILSHILGYVSCILQRKFLKLRLDDFCLGKPSSRGHTGFCPVFSHSGVSGDVLDLASSRSAYNVALGCGLWDALFIVICYVFIINIFVIVIFFSIA